MLDQSVEEKTDAERNIETVRKGLNGILDRYKEQLNAQLMSKTEASVVTMQTYESLSGQLENQNSILEMVKGKGLQEYLCLIEANHLFKECKVVKEELDKDRKQVNIRVREDEMLPDLLQQLTSIGKREVTESEEAVDGVCGTDTSFMNIKSCAAVHKSDIKLPIDRKVPNITGCCSLPDGGVIICDYENMTLNVLDKEMKIIFTVLCKSCPKDVARFDDKSCVVLYSNHDFQIIFTNPGIKLRQEKSTKLSCYGLESFNKMIYISAAKYENLYKSNFGVAEFTKDGDMTKFILLIGSAIQSLSSYLSANIEKSSSYFMFLVPSNNNGYFINKLSSKGHGVFSVCTTSLKKPTSIISDSAGNMLICDTDTKGVHIIDSKGKVGNTVITETDGFGPTSMCLNASKDTLVLASRQSESSKITVYKLKYD